MSAEIVSGGAEGGLKGAAMGSAGGPGGALLGFIIGGSLGMLSGHFQAEEREKKEKEQKRILDERRRIAAESYDLAIDTQNQRVETDDQGQLNAVLEAMKDPSLSMDQKLSIFETQYSQLGTESQKLALAAKQTEQQRIFKQTELENNLVTAKENIEAMQQNRDVGLSQTRNVTGSLGVSGNTIDASAGMQAAQSNLQIEQATRQAGYGIDIGTFGGLMAVSSFDAAVQNAMSGQNLYQTQLDTWAQDSRAGLDLGMTELFNADAGYRRNADLSKASEELTNSSFEWELQQSKDLGANWLFGLVSGLANGVGSAPSYAEAGKAFGSFGKSQGWWGNSGGTKMPSWDKKGPV